MNIGLFLCIFDGNLNRNRGIHRASTKGICLWCSDRFCPNCSANKRGPSNIGGLSSRIISNGQRLILNEREVYVTTLMGPRHVGGCVL